jgi:hypothetical protein
MTKKPTKRRRTQSELANALYKTKPPSRDMARDVQLQSRARGSVSPLGGQALGGLFGPLAGIGGDGKQKRN